MSGFEEAEANDTAGCSPFLAKRFAVVAGLNAASGFISLLASCFVVFLIVLFKKWEFFTQRLVLYLAVSIAYQSIAAIIARVDYNNETSDFYVRFCQFSAFVGQNASWAVLMAVASITVYVFVLAIFRRRTDRYEVVYVLFTFALPLLFNWIPFINTTYGKAGAWCWIRSEDADCNPYVFGEVLQFILWYVPLYVILFILIGLYVVILVNLHCLNRNRWTGDHTHAEEKRNKQISKEIRSLLWYPLIYFIISLFPLFLRIYGLVNVDNPSLVLWILAAFFFPIQGVFIALVFTLEADTRKRLKWMHIRAAAMELCQRSDKTISEYPAENLTLSMESKTSSDTQHTTEYHVIQDNENQVDD